MENLKGRSIKGYDLQQLIGSGGFGAVYRARQAIVDREVAIKVILPHLANKPEFIRNFEAEAHLIARLEHPFIVPLYDFWRDPDGAYLVMRYYPTGNLSQMIHQNGALDLETSARMLEQIASALDTAHASNIIHRDIKPANILLDSAGNAYLSDFGLAEDIGKGTDSSDMVGSPAYLPPEIIQSQQPSPQSDLYSLGFVLYEMLTGVYAFADLTIESPVSSILQFHLYENIPDALSLSDAVNVVIQRATSKDPQDRYPNAMAMATAFRTAIQEEGSAELEAVVTMDSSYMSNPYKGLRAFDEADEYTFFGRDALVQTLLDRLGEETPNHNFLALVGPSGSGKSSVVQAGLIPAIRRGELAVTEDWFILDMLPSSNPFTQLTASIRSIAIDPMYSLERDLQASANALHTILDAVLPTPDDKLLLVIDQFEELFTQTNDKAIRRAFLDLLYTSLQSERFYLVINMRADFYDRPMMHPNFGELIQARTQVVLPLSAQELRQVIVKPAEYVGLTVADDLTTAIIADVQAETVTLPLLQYALTEIFERRDNGHLNLSSYEAIGGIAGALAHRADEIYQSLATSAQDVARQLFLRLVTLGEGTEDTRRRVKQSELQSVISDIDTLQAVLEAFGQARLLTFDNDEASREPTVEVAHEALIREWVLLRDWLEASRDDIRRQRTLNQSAMQWQAENDASYLLRGARLFQIEEWHKTASVQLSQLEHDFISASLAERQRLEQIEVERQENEKQLEQQSQRRLRYLLAVFGVSALVAIGLSLFAFNQATLARQAQDEAEESQVEALRRAEEARSLALASSAQQVYSAGDTELAIAFALDAVNVDETLLDAPPELAYDALVEITHAPGIVSQNTVSEMVIERLAISPDARFAVFGSGQNPSNYLRILGPENDRPSPPDGDRPPRPNGAPPPDGNRPPRPNGAPPPASTEETSAPQGAGVPNIPAPPTNVPYDLSVWDIEAQVLLNPFVGHQNPITDIVFAVRGEQLLLVSASSDGQVIIWDFETRTIERELSVSSGYLVLSPSADGSRLLVSASGIDDDVSQVVLIDLATGDTLQDYPVRPNLSLARMTRDGQFFVTLYLNRDLITHSTIDGTEIMATSVAESIRPPSLDFVISPADDIIAVNTGGDSIPLYDLMTGDLVGEVLPSAAGTHRATFNDDGSQMLAISRDGVVTVWDVERRRFIRDFTSDPIRMNSVTWNSTNDIALMTTPEGLLRRYSIAGNPIDLVDTFEPENIGQSEWLSDTQVLSYGLNTSDLTLWDIPSRTAQLIVDNPMGARNMSFGFSLSPNKEVGILTTNTLTLFEVMTGNILDCAFCNVDLPVARRAIFLSQEPARVFIAGGGSLSLWALDEDTPLWEMPAFSAPVDDIAVSADANYIAIGLQDGDIVVLDSATGEERARFALSDVVDEVRFSPIGRAINDIVFSPDGTLIALANESTNTILLLDWQAGTITQELRGHDASVLRLGFLANGEQLVSASMDTRVIFWEITTGDILNDFAHNLLVLDVSLSPDETHILTTPEDSPIHLWRLYPIALEDAIAWTYENRIVRDLSTSECARYDNITNLCEAE